MFLHDTCYVCQVTVVEMCRFEGTGSLNSFCFVLHNCCLMDIFSLIIEKIIHSLYPVLTLFS
jgi:hypothetical protein